MAEGVVVVAGVFPAGSVVGLFHVGSERVLRPEPHQLVEERVVDERGNVGFDGLEVGGRYFAAGYVNGVYELVRLVGQDAAAPAATELQQPPAGPTPQPVGTQERVEPAPVPAVPAGLAVGVPAAADPANPIVEAAAPEAGDVLGASTGENPSGEGSLVESTAAEAAPAALAVAGQPAEPATGVEAVPAETSGGSSLAWNELVAQATGLGVPAAGSLDEDALRGRIVERGGTPVA